MAADQPASRSQRDVWYADGLRFECSRCNACCGGAPGYVWVEREEIERIAAFLGLETKEFTRRYCRKVWWRISLVEMPDGDCVFLSDEGCRIYPVRPTQCRTFPFWPDIVKSRRRWERAGRRCPGVGSGRLYTAREIERISSGEDET
ncbi:MAG: YkgJ family cysteine cluster protein [Planctomycetota bacterium]